MIDYAIICAHNTTVAALLRYAISQKFDIYYRINLFLITRILLYYSVPVTKFGVTPLYTQLSSVRRTYTFKCKWGDVAHI